MSEIKTRYRRVFDKANTVSSQAEATASEIDDQRQEQSDFADWLIGWINMIADSDYKCRACWSSAGKYYQVAWELWPCQPI